jgi:hypothetical protein
LKIDVTTADTSLVAADQYKIEYRAEGQDVAHLNWGTSAAKAVTLSFWIRSNKTGNTQVAVLNSDNNRAYVATFSISAADTWERKELTIDGDTSGTWLTTNGIGLRLRWGSYGSTYQTSSVNQWVGSQVMSRDDSPINFFDSTDNELYLTGIQLELGEQATPFEHRSFGDELAACQRYFTRVPTTDGSTAYTFIATGMAINGTESIFPVSFPVTMRANPSLATSGSMRVYNGGTLNPSAGITLNSVSTYAASVTVPTGNVHTAKDALLVGANNDADANFQFDAEL